MPATYEPIATTTLGSATNSITFSSIPATYTDLRVVLVGATSVADSIRMRLNSDTTSNYSRTQLLGDGATATSTRASGSALITLTTVSTDTTIPTLITADLFSYAGSTFKTVLATNSQDYNGSGNVGRTVALWRSTSAISTILLYTNAGNFNTGTTAALYGILKA